MSEQILAVLSAGSFLCGMLGAAAFVFGYILYQSESASDGANAPSDALRRASYVLFTLAIIGFAVVRNPEWLLEFLLNTVEWQNWGWNTLTYGAIGAGALAIFQGFGVWRQGIRVHREKQAQTLSFLLFGYSMAYFFSAAIYGVKQKSIALMILAGSGLLHIPIVTGIPKYRAVTTQERWFVRIFFLMIPLMWYATKVELHETFFLVFLFGLLGFIAPQAYRAWKRADTSDLDVVMILSFLIGAIFWFVYGFADNRWWALKVFNPPAFVLWFFILLMWWKKGRLKKKNQMIKATS